MQKRKLKDECDLYMAQLTITVLTRNSEVCNKAVEVITYAANCVENEHDSTAIITESVMADLDEADTRSRLNEFGIEPDEVGLVKLNN